MAKPMDLSGQRFGKLIVQYRANKIGEKPIWHCICDCGNECDVRAKNLRNGNTKSCGCLKSSSLIGEKFGHWTVIDKAKGSGYGSRWVCKCDCGTIKEVSRKSLIAGTSISCGCIKKVYTEDLSNQYINEWFLIQPVNENKSRYLCQCSCGNIKEKNVYDLLNNRSMSCGCKKSALSKGEQKVKELLINNNINFLSQKTFSNCRGNNCLLRFDFYLPELNTAIEYQGEQHYEPYEYFGGQEKYLMTLKYDKIKQDYCKNNNIKLIIIPYWDYDKLNDDYIQEVLLK